MLVSAAARGLRVLYCRYPLFAGSLAAFFSAVQVGNMERQTARLKTNRARIQKRRRDRDGFNVF